MRVESYRSIVGLCFATNLVNYARYGGYYVNFLDNLPTTHPGAAKELMKNGISVSIGIGQFIDGAGEQTFMRSSKTSGGIKDFATNNATYNKWVMSRPYVAKYVEGLLELTGLEGNGHRREEQRNYPTKYVQSNGTMAEHPVPLF